MLRCPFCHETIEERSPRCVACAACGAHHHAECFAEALTCAATACQHTRARVGSTEVDAEGLTALLQQPERLEALNAVPAPAGGAAQGLVGGFLVVVGLLLLTWGFQSRSGIALLASASLGCFGVLLSFGASQKGADLRIPHPGEEPLAFDPIFGTMTKDFLPGLPPNPLSGLEDAMRDGAVERLERPPGEPPAECPDCAVGIERVPEPDLFCFHCGASRLTLDGERWRQPGESDDEPVGEKPAPRVGE